MPLRALNPWLAGRARRATAPRPRRGFAPRLELLDERAVPATFTVTTGADSGPGSLRQAVLDANAAPGPDDIVFAPAVHRVTLTTGELRITDTLDVRGPGARGLTVSGNDASRVFHVEGGSVSIAGLTVARGLADGDAPGVPASGGGILVRAGASLELADVALVGNRAVGDPEVLVPVSPVFNLVGGAGGGGVANFGTLTVTGGTFAGNQALGADHADSSATAFPGPAFPGNAFGGAIANYGTAGVADSRFAHNLARAGSFGTGDFAAIGSGGAILNDSALTVTGSSFAHNRAVGGDDSVSFFHNGHALGGAITSGSLSPLAGGSGATLEVQDSTFRHNQAIGGDGNRTTMPLPPPADGPNNGYGGAVLVYQGRAAIGGSTLTHNRAVGGAGGADQNGSLGVGGGIFFFNFLGAVEGSVTDSVVAHNQAVGGPGGDGLGGGIAAGGLGAPFGAPGTVTITGTAVEHNLAAGGPGGDGLGGGVYNGAGSTMAVSASTVTHNRAQGGKGRGRAADGQGVGGGVYNLGVLALDPSTVVAKNRASTSHDDIFPSDPA